MLRKELTWQLNLKKGGIENKGIIIIIQIELEFCLKSCLKRKDLRINSKKTQCQRETFELYKQIINFIEQKESIFSLYQRLTNTSRLCWLFQWNSTAKRMIAEDRRRLCDSEGMFTVDYLRG